jgi:predicted nucleic acid-binding protein
MNGEIDSLKKCLERLRGTGFWISNPLEKRLLREVEED